MATAQQLRSEVMDMLVTEGVVSPPTGERIRRALNRAKDDLAAKAEGVNRDRFITRKDYEVASGERWIELPRGTVPGEPEFRRLAGLHRVTDNETETRVGVYEVGDVAEKESPTGFWAYLEGRKLWFSWIDGLPEPMTLRLRYIGKVPDLGDDLSEAYEALPSECTDLITLQATLDLLPASNNLARKKYQDRYDQRLPIVLAALERPIADRPLRIRRWEEEA